MPKKKFWKYWTYNEAKRIWQLTKGLRFKHLLNEEMEIVFFLSKKKIRFKDEMSHSERWITTEQKTGAFIIFGEDMKDVIKRTKQKLDISGAEMIKLSIDKFEKINGVAPKAELYEKQSKRRLI